MLIEDSAIDRLVAEILIRNNGLAPHIIKFANAVGALNYLAERNNTTNRINELPELILLDLYLPVIDGFDFLNNLQHLALSVMPTVYVLTVSLYPADRERASSYPCVKGFIMKPLTGEKLSILTNSRR